jgi:hypothetical protein
MPPGRTSDGGLAVLTPAISSGVYRLVLLPAIYWADTLSEPA